MQPIVAELRNRNLVRVKKMKEKMQKLIATVVSVLATFAKQLRSPLKTVKKKLRQKNKKKLAIKKTNTRGIVKKKKVIKKKRIRHVKVQPLRISHV